MIEIKYKKGQNILEIILSNKDVNTISLARPKILEIKVQELTILELANNLIEF